MDCAILHFVWLAFRLPNPNDTFIEPKEAENAFKIIQPYNCYSEIHVIASMNQLEAIPNKLKKNAAFYFVVLLGHGDTQVEIV